MTPAPLPMTASAVGAKNATIRQVSGDSSWPSRSARSRLNSAKRCSSLPPSIQLREFSIEPGEVRVIELAQIPPGRGIHVIEQFHELVRKILAERLVEL